jgi:aminodeoxyfutalosine deaminase
VAGFGLGGEECSIAAREFREVFDRVRSLSLAPLIHAGEWGDSSSVLEAVEELAPVRIAHGFRAASDEGLVRLLARRRIPLDICLQSNRKTRAVVEGERHPVLELIRAGVLVSLSTDDPGLFRATLLGEFVALARLGATVGELRGVLANGFRNGLSRKGTRQDERTRA